MKTRRWLCLILCFLLVTTIPMVVSAHPGKTDSQGGHYDRSTGEYHYHHGYPAHDHYDMDGDGKPDCPYNFEDNTKHKTENNDGYKTDSSQKRGDKVATQSSSESEMVNGRKEEKPKRNYSNIILGSIFAIAYIWFMIILPFRSR